jgi:hypothetical protein
VTDLFIGVVSHEGSRFAVSQGPGGLAAVLAAQLRSLGQSVQVEVSTVDAYDPVQLPITRAMVRACLTAQVHLDRRWARYLGRARGPRWWATHGLRWVRRAEQLVRPPGPKLVERLLNIEMAHFALLRSGLATGADWVLILEDDASSVEVVDCAAGLAWLMSSRADERQPAYVNISQSFALDELGISDLLTVAPDASWAGDAPRHILSSARPATNTVCAILYRGSFVRDLLAVTDALPMEPVVPIDWKLNLALMQMFSSGALGAGDCWFVDPAPIDQLSMRGGI